VNPTLDKKSVKTVSVKGVKKMLEVAENESFPERDLLVLSMLLLSGVRIQELAQLKITNINMEERSIFINGKGKKERTLYMTKEIHADLKAYLPIRERRLREKGVI
jgi:site-specific recombinase XerD